MLGVTQELGRVVAAHTHQCAAAARHEDSAEHCPACNPQALLQVQELRQAAHEDRQQGDMRKNCSQQRTILSSALFQPECSLESSIF